MLSLWNVASHKYWEIRDHLDALLDDRAALSKGEIPQIRAKIVNDDKFVGKGVLHVVVGVQGAVAFEVKVGGRTASHVGGSTYAVDARGFKPSEKGLGLELIAR